MCLHEGDLAYDWMHGRILTWQSAVSLGCLQVENNLFYDNRCVPEVLLFIILKCASSTVRTP